MKVKLLKAIRNDTRFFIQREQTVKGYPHSGWWYLRDSKLDLFVRNKKLKPILKEYLRFLELMNRVKAYKRIIAVCAVIMVLFIFLSCTEDQIEVWPMNSVLTKEDSINARNQELIYLMETGLTSQQAEEKLNETKN